MTDNNCDECCICYNHYGVQERDGYILEKKTTICKHNMCVDCFKILFKDKSRMNCPMCRTDISDMIFNHLGNYSYYTTTKTMEKNFINLMRNIEKRKLLGDGFSCNFKNCTDFSADDSSISFILWRKIDYLLKNPKSDVKKHAKIKIIGYKDKGKGVILTYELYEKIKF